MHNFHNRKSFKQWSKSSLKYFTFMFIFRQYFKNVIHCVFMLYERPAGACPPTSINVSTTRYETGVIAINYRMPTDLEGVSKCFLDLCRSSKNPNGAGINRAPII